MPGRSGLISTKLRPGRAAADLIVRPRLTAVLGESLTRKLTLLSAPAGYGKSVLLTQFLGESSVPAVWYQLDEFDNDLAVFLEYLVAGIKKHRPDFGDTVLEIVGKSNDLSADGRRIVAYMVNELGTFSDSGLVIVLDDYHRISDRSVHAFIEQLLDYLPPGVHLVISTRTRPPLKLTRLKVQGTMLEIGDKDLRFTKDETESLINGAGASGDASVLYRDTQGWPAAVQLMAMALRDGEKEVASSKGRTRRDIYDYLASEVFDALSGEEQEFLTRTSVFRAVVPRLADKLLGWTSGSEAMLRSLAEKGLFISPLEGENDAYRYHDLFREFLKTRLGDASPAMLCKAGQCLFEEGQVERAVEYFIEAKDWGNAAEAMVPAGQANFRHGRWKTVARWLQQLPPESLDINPWLILYRGVLAIYAGSLDEAEEILEAAKKAFEDSGDEVGAAQPLIYKASIMRLRGRYAAGMRLIEEALARLDPSSLDLAASTEHAAAMYMQGNFEESIKVLKSRLAVAERLGDRYVAGALLEDMSSVYYMTGDYAKSIEAHQRSLELLPSPSYDNVASILAEWGDVDHAVEHGKSRLQAIEGTGVAQSRPFGHYQCGLALMHKGELDEAASHFRQAIEHSRESGGGRFSEVLNLTYLARCLTLQGRHDEALRTAERAFSAGKDQSPYVKAICETSLAVVLLRTGEVDKCLAVAGEAAAAFQEFGAKAALMRCQAMLATAYLVKGQRDQAIPLAAACFRQAAAERCVQEFVTWFEDYEDLLALALQEGIEPEFVIGIVKLVGEGTVPMLDRLSRSESPSDRLAAARALAVAGGAGARETLARLMNDADVQVSDAAVAALRSLSVRNPALGGPASVSTTLGSPSLGSPALGSPDMGSPALGVPSLGSPSLRGSSTNSPTLSGPAQPAPQQGIAQPVPGVRSPGKDTALQCALYVTCLGPFRVFAGDREIEVAWRTTKARDIFAYLIDHSGGPVSKERLLEDLWPDADASQSSTLFHTSLYQLRKTLRDLTGWDETVMYAAGHYRLARGLVSSDVDALDRLMKSVEQGQPSGTAALAETDILGQAVALYHGSYLEDLDYEWVVPERRRLEDLYAATAERLATKYMEAGETAKAASTLRSLLHRNPLLEDVHCLLMSCYASMGDRLAVMQQYETLKDILERELGVDPAPKTRTLYYRLCGEQ